MIAFRCPRCGRLHVEIEDDISSYTEYTCGGCGKKFLFTDEVEKLLKDNDIELKEMSEEQKKHLDELLESSAMCFNNVENKIESWQNYSVLNIQFEEIHLTEDMLDIKINNERVKQFDTLVINGIEFVKKVSADE